MSDPVPPPAPLASAGQILWKPSRERATTTRLAAFTREAEKRAGRSFPSYRDLHLWSVTDRAAFWELVWDFTWVIGGKGGRIVEDADRMPGARFFPDARLNFAENLLRQTGRTPLIFATDETGRERTITADGLRELVRRAAAQLRAGGITSGDRVAGVVGNTPEAVIAALAAASIGAIWSSCSPDFGVAGILDRFGQIDPSVLIATAEYSYGGKRFDNRAKIKEVVAALPVLKRVVGLDGEGDAGSTPAIEWNAWLDAAPASALTFEQFPFACPLYILYSSGTTGIPKCIVHGAGGTLLQHLKEHQLHCDVRSGDRVFYFTTCGWMMWNWLVTALASGAAIVLYDGAPFQPDGNRLFDLADRFGVTLFGTSAKFIDAVQKAGLEPARTHSLASVRTITSTGSPLAPASFDFVYQHIKADVHLASISGGTDIVSCFVGGVPTEPVRRGEIQAPGLGMAVDVFDENGAPVRDVAGELVCKSPFPSMPVGFWNDPDGARYRAAYFERFPGVWCHGDWAAMTPAGGVVIAGRSDATLNPGGVRIGTAEIYRQVERLPEIAEALAVGQQWQGDERVVLFVRLQPGRVLDDELRDRIAKEIRANTTPRHVPAKIVAIADIPRTKSGKIVELAVRNVIHGREVKNREALANPEALELFKDVAELQT
jgi:acetoacetyl-CoA synthetase